MNVSGCILQYDYGFATFDKDGGDGLVLDQILQAIAGSILSGGDHTCTVSIIDTAICKRSIAPKTSAAVTLTIQCE